MKYSLLYLISTLILSYSASASEEILSPASPVTVLFIDDVKSNRMIVGRKLSDASNTVPFIVELAESRREGLKSIKEGKQYNIIISDLETDDGDIKPDKFARSARKNSKELEGLFLYTACAKGDLLSDPELQAFDKILKKPDIKSLVEVTTATHIEYTRRKSLEGTSPRMVLMDEKESLTAPLLAQSAQEPSCSCSPSLDNVVCGLVWVVFKFRDRVC